MQYSKAIDLSHTPAHKEQIHCRLLTLIPCSTVVVCLLQRQNRAGTICLCIYRGVQGASFGAIWAFPAAPACDVKSVLIGERSFYIDYSLLPLLLQSVSAAILLPELLSLLRVPELLSQLFIQPVALQLPSAVYLIAAVFNQAPIRQMQHMLILLYCCCCYCHC
jgi:hypothetical protein